MSAPPLQQQKKEDGASGNQPVALADRLVYSEYSSCILSGGSEEDDKVEGKRKFDSQPRSTEANAVGMGGRGGGSPVVPPPLPLAAPVFGAAPPMVSAHYSLCLSTPLHTRGVCRRCVVYYVYVMYVCAVYHRE